MRIRPEEYALRRESFAAQLESRGLAGAVLFDAHYVSFTVEPGLYAGGVGGFRHSDVAVTEDGLDFLTYYPRDLESLTLPA
jgi:hypothetical protein